MTVSIYKGKGKRTECRSYRGISLISVVGKTYTGILLDRARMTMNKRVSDQGGGL